MLVPLTQSFTLSQIVFALVFSLVGIGLFIRHGLRFDTRVLQFTGILFFLAVLISVVGLLAQGGLQRSLSDGTRWIFLAIYILVGYEAGKRLVTEAFLIRALKYYAIFSVVFSMLVFVDPLHGLVDLFKGRMSNDTLPFHFYRFSGFSGFPTDLGSVLTLIFCLIVVDIRQQYFSNKEKLLVMLLIGVGLIGSASRGGVLHLGTVLILVVLARSVNFLSTFKIKPNRIKPYFGMGLVILLIGVPLLIYKGDSIDLMRYLTVNVADADESVTHRFAEILGAYDVLFNSYFLFGEDRQNPLGLPVIEGFWTHLLLRYSWLGVAIGLLTLYLFTRYSFASKCVICRGLGLWFLSFFVTSAFFSDVFFRFKGPLLYGFLFGYCLYHSRRPGNVESMQPISQVSS